MTPFTDLLLDAALKGTLILFAAALLMILMRRGSAAARHLVWQLALIAVLCLPVVKLMSPLRFAVLPDFRSPISTPLAAIAEAELANVISNATSVTAPPVSFDSEPLNAAAPAQSLEAPAKTAAPLPVRVLFWSALVWMVVAAALLLRLAFGFVLVRWFALRAYPLYENGWQELSTELAHKIGLRAPVQLLGSPHIATPMTWGVTRPIIMLPSAAEDWTDERRRVVLLHELAHVRRRDSLAHMFAQVACAVYWFHPLVWKAAARMRAEAERACDDLVLRAGTRASVYAEHLLELIRTIGGMRTPSVALPMAQRSTFEGRLLAILEPHLDRTSPRPLAVVGMVMVVGLVIFPLAGLTTSSDLNATVMNSGTEQFDDVEPGKRAERESKRSPSESVATSPSKSANNNSNTNTNTNTNTNSNANAQERQVSAAVLNSLIGALSDRNVEVRLESIEALGKLEDERAVAALSAALRNDSDARVRKTAAWALGNIESVRGVPALEHALRNDRDVEVRRTSVWALGQIEDDSAVPALSQALRDGDVEIRRQSAWALGQIESASAVPALGAALRDSDAEVRATAVWALGQIESEEAVAPLSQLTNDANADVRKQAAWALGQIEAASAVPALGRLLREDRDVEVRQTAAWALGQIESANAVPALSAALKDASADVRKTSAWALGQIEARPAPAALHEALRDASPAVRGTAAWALAEIEDPGSVSALRAAMKDENAEVRRAVLRALTQIGDEAGYEALADMLKDPDPEVRKAAAAALGGRRGSWPDPRPQPQPQPRPMPRPIH